MSWDSCRPSEHDVDTRSTHKIVNTLYPISKLCAGDATGSQVLWVKKKTKSHSSPLWWKSCSSASWISIPPPPPPPHTPRRSRRSNARDRDVCALEDVLFLEKKKKKYKSPSTRFYFDTYAFWKITDVFSWTADAHQADGWCPRA